MDMLRVTWVTGENIETNEYRDYPQGSCYIVYFTVTCGTKRGLISL